MQKYSSLILRFGMAAVFAWFGVSQVSNPEMWVSVVPAWASSLLHLAPATIVYANGVFEIVASLLLAGGIMTRWVALLLGVHLFIIATTFGLSPVGVRDFGLSFALFAISFAGKDEWSLC